MPARWNVGQHAEPWPACVVLAQHRIPNFARILQPDADISRTLTIRVISGFRVRPGSVKTRIESPRQKCPEKA
jgi:hypothetical protein